MAMTTKCVQTTICTGKTTMNCPLKTRNLTTERNYIVKDNVTIICSTFCAVWDDDATRIKLVFLRDWCILSFTILSTLINRAIWNFCVTHPTENKNQPIKIEFKPQKKTNIHIKNKKHGSQDLAQHDAAIPSRYIIIQTDLAAHQCTQKQRPSRGRNVVKGTHTGWEHVKLILVPG